MFVERKFQYAGKEVEINTFLMLSEMKGKLNRNDFKLAQ